MIILNNEKTYNFEGIHIPRIYINDVKQVRESLDVLQRNGSLTNKEMAEETARVRSEDIREIFYLLWRLGFGIDVTRKGKEIVFVANDKLQSILEMDDKELKGFCYELSDSKVTCYTQEGRTGGKQCRGGQWELIPQAEIKKVVETLSTNRIHCTSKGCI